MPPARPHRSHPLLAAALLLALVAGPAHAADPDRLPDIREAADLKAAVTAAGFRYDDALRDLSDFAGFGTPARARQYRAALTREDREDAYADAARHRAALADRALFARGLEVTEVGGDPAVGGGWVAAPLGARLFRLGLGGDGEASPGLRRVAVARLDPRAPHLKMPEEGFRPLDRRLVEAARQRGTDLYYPDAPATHVRFLFKPTSAAAAPVARDPAGYAVDLVLYALRHDRPAAWGMYREAELAADGWDCDRVGRPGPGYALLDEKPGPCAQAVVVAAALRPRAGGDPVATWVAADRYRKLLDTKDPEAEAARARTEAAAGAARKEGQRELAMAAAVLKAQTQARQKAEALYPKVKDLPLVQAIQRDRDRDEYADAVLADRKAEIAKEFGVTVKELDAAVRKVTGRAGK